MNVGGADVVHQWIVGFRRIAGNDNHVHCAGEKKEERIAPRTRQEGWEETMRKNRDS